MLFFKRLQKIATAKTHFPDKDIHVRESAQKNCDSLENFAYKCKIGNVKVNQYLSMNFLYFKGYLIVILQRAVAWLHCLRFSNSACNRYLATFDKILFSQLRRKYYFIIFQYITYDDALGCQSHRLCQLSDIIVWSKITKTYVQQLDIWLCLQINQ